MGIITCDVCGMVLDSKTPLTIPHKSDMFDYDLCSDCKIKEKSIDMRKVYLEKLKEAANKKSELCKTIAPLRRKDGFGGLTNEPIHG